MLSEADHEKQHLEKRIEEEKTSGKNKDKTIKDKDDIIAEQQQLIEQLLREQEEEKNQKGTSLFGRKFSKPQQKVEPVEEQKEEGEKPVEEVPVPTFIKVGENQKFIQQEGLGGNVWSLPAGTYTN